MNKIRLIITILMVGLLLHGFIKNVSAVQISGRSFSPPSGWHYNPAPVTVPPQVPPWYPGGFFNVWKTEDVIDALNERGIEVNRILFETVESHENLAVSAKEIVKIFTSLSGEEWDGIILSFELKDNLNKARKYYLELNNRGELYTWSFIKDNILLVLPGSIAEEKAKQYKKALNSMKNK